MALSLTKSIGLANPNICLWAFRSNRFDLLLYRLNKLVQWSFYPPPSRFTFTTTDSGSSLHFLTQIVKTSLI